MGLVMTRTYSPAMAVYLSRLWLSDHPLLDPFRPDLLVLKQSQSVDSLMTFGQFLTINRV